MDTTANKQLVRRFVADVFEGLRPEAVDELVGDDFHSHTFGPSGSDKAYLRQATQRMGATLTDIKFVVEDTVAEDDKVAVRLTASARTKGKPYTIGEIHIFRVRDGKIVEHWHQYDSASMMKQLGGDKGA
jgi:predicted ester cyclase